MGNEVRNNLKYTDTHEWVKLNGETAHVGITDHAQSELTDIVFVELPEVGSTLEKGEEFGTVESVKAVSELFAPIAGEVLELNPALADSPELVNNDPYGQGWMLKVKPAEAGAFEKLLTRDAYLAVLKG